MKQEILRLEAVSKFYTNGQNVVMGLNEVNLTMHSGEFIAVTGESGSGKSTLAHILSGVLPYEGGELYLQGSPTSHYDSRDWEGYRRDKISFISQNYGLLPGSSVLSNVVSALYLAGLEKQAAAQRAKELLVLVELWELRHRPAAKLSSGQKQRLAIARALSKPAPILIADEPTGNLDPENSEKVIRLLAEAAKERLVILITHDFSEAESYVTRRIGLRDGRVILDSQLREAIPQRPEAEKMRRAPKDMGIYTARLQLTGRPVWSALLLLFCALTAFSVFAFLGTFLMHFDDTNTRIYDASAFLNGNRTRIVVQRGDGGVFTQEDFEKLLMVDSARYLERSGYVTDVNYAWREGKDYTYHYSVHSQGLDSEGTAAASLELLGGMPYLQTVPMLPDGEVFLTAGREPENMYEVVLCGSQDRLGEVIRVYLRDVKNWNLISDVTLDVTVVGVTDFGSGLYFDEELGAVFTAYRKTQTMGARAYLLAPVYGAVRTVTAESLAAAGDDYTAWPEGSYRLTENGDVEILLLSGECAPSEQMFLRHSSNQQRYGVQRTWGLYNANGAGDPEAWESYEEVQAVTYHDSRYNGLLLLHPEDFAKLAWQGNADQASLFLTDYAYTDRALEQLHEMGYVAISPYQQGSTEKDPELSAERMQTLSVCLAAMAAVTVLTVLVLRALFAMETESYRLLSHMGLSRKAAGRSLLWQVLMFALGGQLLTLAAVLLCGNAGVEKVVELLRYLPVGNFLLLSAAHWLLSLLGAAVVMSGVIRQVYPLGAEGSDLNWEEAAV